MDSTIITTTTTTTTSSNVITSEPPLKKRRLYRSTPRENAEMLYQNDPYNVELWMNVVEQAHKHSTIEEQRYVLDLFLKLFPTAAPQWRYYIELELSENNLQQAENLFSQCHLQCLDAELFDVYLDLKTRMNETLPAPKFRQKMTECFDYVMKCVGQDIHADRLWKRYITFLRKGVDAKSGEEIDKIRRVYQRALRTPMDNLEQIWDSYVLWEQSTNKDLAEALIDVHREGYNLAQQVYKDRKRHRRGIILHFLARPSKTIQRQDRNYQQVQLWERLIEFERSNPQNLEQKELLSRLEFTFRQALMATRNYPDIWLLYADFSKSAWNSIERTEKVFEQALQAIPDCILLHLMYADFLELNKSIEEAENVYVRLIAGNKSSLPTGSDTNERSSKAKQLLVQNISKNIQSVNPLAFVFYFLFLRRTQGKDAAREFFVGCAKLKLYPLYIAAASIEETVNNDRDAAYRILTRGWKDFSSILDYGYGYLKFLLTYSSTRKEEIEHVFQEVLPLIDTKENTSQEGSINSVLNAQIFDLYIKFRQRQLHLQNIEASQQMRDEKLRSNRIEKLLHRIDRYSFGHLLPVNESYKLTLLRALQNASSGNSNETNAAQTQRKLEKMEHIVNPDVTQLIAFRPGIRFLTRLDDTTNTKNEDGEIANETQDLLDQINCPDAIRELLQLLPAPSQTQLLVLPSLPPCVVNVDALITFMKLNVTE